MLSLALAFSLWFLRAAVLSEIPLMLTDSWMPELELCCSPQIGKALAILSLGCQRLLALDEKGN